MVVGIAGLYEARRGRPLVEAGEQDTDRLEAQLRVAPGKISERREPMLLDGKHDCGVERSLIGGGAQRTVPHVAARAPPGLGDLRPRHAAPAPPPELWGGGGKAPGPAPPLPPPRPAPCG